MIIISIDSWFWDCGIRREVIHMGQDHTVLLKTQQREIRSVSRKLTRNATKSEQKQAEFRDKVLLAMEKGQTEVACIAAQNAIQEKKQMVELLKLASQMDALSQRLEHAINVNTLGKTFVGIDDGLKQALESMDTAKIAAAVDRFARNFEELDFQSEVMSSEIKRTTHVELQEGEVNELMHQVADEHGLKVQEQLVSVPRTTPMTLSESTNPFERVEVLVTATVATPSAPPLLAAVPPTKKNPLEEEDVHDVAFHDLETRLARLTAKKDDE